MASPSVRNVVYAVFFIPPFASFSSLLKDTRNWDTGKGERNSHSLPGLVCIQVWDSINV